MLLFYNDLDNMDKNLLLTAIRASLEAGSEIMSVYTDPNADFEIEKKADNSPLTIADRKSHMVIAARLASTPYPVLSEEGKKIPVEERQSWNELWIVDPLDGTTNYIHDEAPYCVSIALRSRTELLLGVVYEVCRDECFYAWKGGKAFMNGEEIHVSNVEDIKDAFVITELPYNHLQYKQTALHLIDQLYGVVGGIRMNGSAAAAICYVAIGRFDAWMEAFLGKWDYSAAALIVQEAGGKVTDFYGEDHFIEGHHIIATNGNLHPFFQKLLAEVPPLNM